MKYVVVFLLVTSINLFHSAAQGKVRPERLDKEEVQLVYAPAGHLQPKMWRIKGDVNDGVAMKVLNENGDAVDYTDSNGDVVYVKEALIPSSETAARVFKGMDADQDRVYNCTIRRYLSVPSPIATYNNVFWAKCE